MAEKRRPHYIFLLKKVGKDGSTKTNKVEVFAASLWIGKKETGRGDPDLIYRLRVNGKWWPKGEVRYYHKTRIMQFIARSVNMHPRG